MKNSKETNSQDLSLDSRPFWQWSSKHLHHYHSLVQLDPSSQKLIDYNYLSITEEMLMLNQQLTKNLTQQATVLSSARDGKYFCFCISDPHNPILERKSMYKKLSIII